MATQEHNWTPGDGADAVNESEYARKLAGRYRCAFVDLREQHIDPELFRTIPADLMFRYNFVPLEVQNNSLSIAVSDPSLVLLSDELPLLLGKKLAIKVATARQIGDILKRTEQSQRVLEQATEAFTLQVSKEDEESEETISGDRLTRDSTVSPVVRLVETIIFTALERRASDIHIEARDTEVAVKYRIDGVLQHAMQPIAKEWHSTVLSRIKVLSDLDIAERRVPQDGRFRVKYKGRFIDLRVSIMPASHGEDAVLRVLDKETLSEKFQSLSLDVVGFSELEVKRFRRYIQEPYGMVLVTGPTGSGKTSTLYASINRLNKTDVNIMTAEDPVEFNFAGVNQVQVREQIGLTFAAALRSFLRQDPNIVLVGEIRDFETAEIAIKAALTGHLVLSTLHTNDAPSTITRLLNMGIEPFLVATAVNLICAQRLIRKICSECKTEVKLPPQSLIDIGVSPAEAAATKVYKGNGCKNCNDTGYRGRVGLFEVMQISEEIQEMIFIGASARELRKKGIENGMLTLRQSGIQKIRDGMTTIEEVVRETVRI